MRQLERLRHELDETKRKLARAEKVRRLIAKQRDEFKHNADDYQAALTAVVEAIGVLGDGAVSRLGTAQAKAYERLNDRFVTHQATDEKR